MKKSKARNIIEKVLSLADIKIDGHRPWDIHVHNEKLFHRVLSQGVLGLGEGYMDGWWECDDLEGFFYRLSLAGIENQIKGNPWMIFQLLWARFINLQSSSRAFIVGEQHYDLGNDLFESMLDRSMAYSCGYWKDTKDLGQAQYNKLDLVCRKLRIQPGQKVLDIGCGWGSFSKHAAEHYKAEVVGITISKEQAKLARENCKGLPVEIRVQDYRELDEKFDYVVSIGMFEHVGFKNYRTYMQVVKGCLKEDGLSLLHTIGKMVPEYALNPWMDKYIFPNAAMPTYAAIVKACQGLLAVKDWHSFGEYYYDTLMAWYVNFEENWDKLKSAKYDERFRRMWHLYLLSCAAGFRSREYQVWQIVFSKNEIVGGYESIR